MAFSVPLTGSESEVAAEHSRAEHLPLLPSPKLKSPSLEFSKITASTFISKCCNFLWNIRGIILVPIAVTDIGQEVYDAINQCNGNNSCNDDFYNAYQIGFLVACLYFVLVYCLYFFLSRHGVTFKVNLKYPTWSVQHAADMNLVMEHPYILWTHRATGGLALAYFIVGVAFIYNEAGSRLGSGTLFPYFHSFFLLLIGFWGNMSFDSSAKTGDVQLLNEIIGTNVKLQFGWDTLFGIFVDVSTTMDALLFVGSLPCYDLLQTDAASHLPSHVKNITPTEYQLICIWAQHRLQSCARVEEDEEQSEEDEEEDEEAR